MESIEDVIKEMRALGGLDEESTDKIPRSLQALGLRTYADRIETAVEYTLAVEKAKAAGEGYAAGEQSVANCNQFKVRKALKEILAIIKVYNRALISTRKTIDTIEEIIKQVLASPARNCDPEGAEGK